MIIDYRLYEHEANLAQIYLPTSNIYTCLYKFLTRGHIKDHLFPIYLYMYVCSEQYLINEAVAEDSFSI